MNRNFPQYTDIEPLVYELMRAALAFVAFGEAVKKCFPKGRPLLYSKHSKLIIYARPRNF